jgi:hypothetical protein
MATVLNLQDATKSKPGRKARKQGAPRAFTRPASVAALRRQHIAAGAVATLAGALTFLSVHHLAFGYQAVTGCAQWEALVSAIGIDCGFLLLEIAQIVTVRDTTLRFVSRWANPATVVTLVGSASLNSFAFMQGAPRPFAVTAACLMGCFVPGFIYVLTRVAAHLAHH